MYLSTSTSTEDFPEMYLSTFQVLYKLYLSTDVLKYKVLQPGSGVETTYNYESNGLKLKCMQYPAIHTNYSTYQTAPFQTRMIWIDLVIF